MVIDIIVLVVLLISAGVAFLRGFIREVLTITGVVGGMIVGYAMGPMLAVHVREWIGANPTENSEEVKKLFDLIPYTIIADVLAYGVIFIVVVIILSIISHRLAEGARAIGMGAIDRTLGVIFGLVRGLVLLGILYLPVYALTAKDTREGWFDGSQTHFYIEQTTKILTKFLPEGSGLNPDTNDSETVNNARETLEGINLLQKGSDKLSEQRSKGAQASNPSLNSNTIPDGYSEEFRDNMDELFEQQSDDVRVKAYND